MKPSTRHAALIRIAAPPVAIVLCAVALTGCIIIPVDYYATGSRQNVVMASTNVLQVGITTREDTLLTLGEPDFVSDDGRRFGYRWTKVKAVWAVASYGGTGAAGEVTRSYLIEISFDQTNRVSDVRLLMNWGDLVTGMPDGETSR